MAAMSFSCLSGFALDVAPCSVVKANVSACVTSCAGRNSAIRSAVVASVLTLSMFVLARMDRIFTGNVFKKICVRLSPCLQTLNLVPSGLRGL